MSIVIYIATLWNLRALVRRLTGDRRQRASAIVLSFATTSISLCAVLTILVYRIWLLDLLLICAGSYLWLGTGFVNRFDFRQTAPEQDPMTSLLALILSWPLWFLRCHRLETCANAPISAR